MDKGRPRIRGTLTCARMFAERGNPWVTKKDAVSDFPLSHSMQGDTPMTEEEKQKALIRDRLNLSLGRKLIVRDFAPPRPTVRVDPDLDAFTKAEKRKERPRYVDPKGTPTEATPHRRKTNIARAMHRDINKITKPIKVK
jgi:hypothetical protein